MTQTFLVRKPVKVGYEYRQPGQLLPEAASWSRVEHLVHSGFLVRVEREDAEIEAALAQAEESTRLAVLERDTKRDTPVNTGPHPGIGQPLAGEGIVYDDTTGTQSQAGPDSDPEAAPDPVNAAEKAATEAVDAAASGDAQGAVVAAQEAHQAARLDDSGSAEAYAEIADEAAEEALADEGYKLPRAELEKMSDADLVDLAKSAGLRVRARDKVIDRLSED